MLLLGLEPSMGLQHVMISSSLVKFLNVFVLAALLSVSMSLLATLAQYLHVRHVAVENMLSAAQC